MGLQHQVAIIGIEDAKFTPDGGTATDIKKIEELNVDGDFADFVVPGDNSIEIRELMTGKATVKLKSASLDLDAIAALTDGTVEETGTSPSTVATLKLTRKLMPKGTLEGQGILIGLGGADTEPADVHFKIYNFSIDSLPLSMVNESVAEMDLSGKAYPDKTAGATVEITFNETKTAIS